MSKEVIKLSDIVNPYFSPLFKGLDDPNILNIVQKGGRAGGKSFNITIGLVRKLIKEPITILAVRKVANTHKDSCYEQFKRAILEMGLQDHFHFGLSPLKITYKERGNSILFRGADDANKIKSITNSTYPITTVWIEECGEFMDEKDINIIKRSIVRESLPEGLHYKFVISYNPPRRKDHWLNANYDNNPTLPSNTIVQHSTYMDNPFLSESAVEEAENEKTRNPTNYKWEYLGEPIGSGVVPFNNLSFREITNKEIKAFKTIIQGCDFGYSVDPLAFVRCSYDKKKRTLYIVDEIYQVKLSNRMLSEKLKKKKYHLEITHCDSAEPKSIDELKGYNCKVKPARKPKGSVEYGEKWLDDLTEIIIDPVRCPNTAREFRTIDYATDSHGNTIPRLVDKDNHTIDAVRYACSQEMVMKKKFF